MSLYQQEPQEVKKLVVVLVTSISMTGKKIEKNKVLEWVLYISYFVTFKNQIKTFLDSKNEVNIIKQIFAF